MPLTLSSTRVGALCRFHPFVLLSDIGVLCSSRLFSILYGILELVLLEYKLND
jgi:hypothetical protein